MKILFRQLTYRNVMTLMVVILFISSSCKSENRSSEERIPLAEDEATEDKSNDEQYDTNDESMKKVKVAKNEQDTTKKVKIELPTPEVELPEISYDKKKLSKIQELDKMLTDAAIINEAAKQFDEMFRELKNANAYGSLDSDGTLEGKIRAINKVADSFIKFNENGKVLGEKLVAMAKENYKGDDEFTSLYRETYKEAEEQVNEMILDNVLRRKVLSEMANVYRYGSSFSSSYVESNLEKAKELKREVISGLVSGANTDIMISDYKKGKELTDLLNGTNSMLTALQSLKPDESEIESIEAMKIKVEEAKKKRIAEVIKAREEYRFPARYSSGNAPSNAGELEKKMEAYLKKTTYSGKYKYDVRKIVVAGPWIEVRSVFGIVMYYQIDFYVANKYELSEPGLLEICFVTGKTSGPDINAPFGTLSVAGAGDMLEKNLD